MEFEVGDRIGKEKDLVIKIKSDGHVTFKNKYGKLYVIYNKDNDKSLKFNQYWGVIVKISNNKKLVSYDYKVFKNLVFAKNWVKNEKKKHPKFYYRIEEVPLTICDLCGKLHFKKKECKCRGGRL